MLLERDHAEVVATERRTRLRLNHWAVWPTVDETRACGLPAALAETIAR